MRNYIIYILVIISILLAVFSCEVPVEETQNDKISNKNKNLILNPNADEGENYWSFYESGTSECGVDSMSSNNVFYIQGNNNDMTFIFQNINLPADSSEKYILIIGYSWFEEEITGYNTNRPYLWGEEQDSGGGSLNYYQQLTLSHDGSERTWKTLYGIYQLNPGASIIKFELGQGANAIKPTNGTKAAFDDIEILIFNTQTEAEAYRDSYILSHPEVFE